jgi:hypothetical protein
MRMRIVMQLSGKMVSLFTQVLVWLKVQLWNLVSNLRVVFSQVSLNVVNLLNRLVKTLSNFKALLANLIIVVQSIKLVLKRAVTINGQIGQQLLTIARQIPQLVKQALKKDK